jgi:glycosyltransferase involved in cell wall biosynthesis
VVLRGLALLDPSRPFHVALYSHNTLARLVRSELAERPYDLVYSHFLYHLGYVSDSSVRVVIDQQNVDRVYWGNKADNSPFPLNVFARWNMRKTIAYENRRLTRIWGYVSVCEEDRQQTLTYAQPSVKHFWVAPNGVDTRRFTPAEANPATGKEVTLGYLGSMDLQMNVEAVRRFCTALLPRIRHALPGMDVRFLAIGREPTAAIRRLAEATPGMSLSGTVEDVVPWLQKLDILVCPLRIGAGTKLKVAEAMSCGLPVIGSSMAFAGLPGESGEHYVRADSDDSFIPAVCRLARTPGERVRIGRNARELAQTHLEWDAIGQQIVGQIQEALVND